MMYGRKILDVGDNDSQYLLDKQNVKKRGEKERKWSLGFATLNFLFLIVNLVVFLEVLVRKPVLPKGPEGILLPHSSWVSPAIHYELRSFDDTFGIHGPFRGIPRSELDDAWSEILQNYTLRIPKPGWQNATSSKHILTEYQDSEGGIMGTFSFLHNIHCLKSIRQYLLSDYYPDTEKMFTTLSGEVMPAHIDHCFDMYVRCPNAPKTCGAANKACSLRQSELCHADTSITVFEWREEEERPVNIHGAQHVCAKADKLNEWLQAHTVPPFGPILVNPWTGKSPF